MNIVIIKHFGDICPYLFSVPNEVHLKENDMVLVQTRRGEQQGKCVCDSFTVDESPLKPTIEVSTMSILSEHTRSQTDCIPAKTFI